MIVGTPYDEYNNTHLFRLHIPFHNHIDHKKDRGIRNPYTFCMLLGFHARLTKIDSKKITSNDFLPLLQPKKKIMDIPVAM